MNFKHHPLALLDTWGHKLHLPKWLQHPICDWFDRWLGVYDEEDLNGFQ